MKKIFQLLLLIIMIGCSSPQESLNKRNFDRAYKTALKQLEKGKSVKKNKATLFAAVEGIMDEQLGEKDRLVKTNQLENLEQALKINQEVQVKIDKAMTYLDESFQEDLNNLQKEEIELTAVIAKTYFEDGEIKLNDALANNDKHISRDACMDFLKARDYGYDSEIVEPLLVKSRDFAVIRYAVHANAPFDIEYNWEIDRIMENLENIDYSFVEVYFEKMNNPDDIDGIIKIDLRSLGILINEDNQQYNYSANVVVGTQTQTNNEGEQVEVEITETVQGTVINQIITKSTEWQVSINVQSITKNCVIRDTYFNDVASFSITNYILSGDERAIPREYRNYYPDQMISDVDLNIDAFAFIYEKVVNYIYN